MTKILLVEDEPNVRLLCQLEFEDDGYEVRAVGDVTEAWKQLCSWDPDLAVVEPNLGQDSGITLLSRMLAASLPVRTVFYSAEAFDASSPSCADALVLKSVDLGELKATVRRLLASSTRRSEATATP